MLLLLNWMALDAEADAERFATHYRVCPHLLPGPQELRAERTLKAGELRVSWERVDTSSLGPRSLFAETFITVIVDDGSTTTVRQARPTTTEILVDGLSRGGELEITAAITRRLPQFCEECARDWHPPPEHEAIIRQQHLLSEISRVRLRTTQTRSWDRPRSDREATTVRPALPTPTRPFSLLPAPQPSVAAGYNLSYWVDADGSLAMLDDIMGKFIGPDPDDRMPPSGMFKSVGMGRYHGCAVLQNTDTVECWGTVRSWLDFTVPQDLGPVNTLDVGWFHNCAIKPDGTAQCWGYDRYGQAQVPAGEFHSVHAGYFHTCGVRPTGQVECWGDNRDGQLDVPAGLGPARAMTAGAYHNCAIQADDTVACWGWNKFGQLDVPTNLRAVKSVSAGRYHTCALRTGDSITCWGDNRYGQRSQVPSSGNWQEVSAGIVHSCGRKQDGTVECWRFRDTTSPPMKSLSGYTDGSYGLRQADSFIQGWGDVRSLSTKGRVDGRGVYPVPYKSFEDGSTAMCAITLDDTLDCWGRSTSTVVQNLPGALGKVKMISVTDGNACAIKADDTLACWGDNNNGQANVPASVTTVKMVATSVDHTCAIKVDDTLACWGDNTYNQSDVASNLGTVKMVALGAYHTCVIKSDDSVACWGDNANDQTNVPSALGSVKAISASRANIVTCAIKADDTVACWGIEGGITANVVPSDLGTVSAISAGFWHVCALLKSDQTVRCWGDNEEGQSAGPKFP